MSTTILVELEKADFASKLSLFSTAAQLARFIRRDPVFQVQTDKARVGPDRDLHELMEEMIRLLAEGKDGVFRNVHEDLLAACYLLLLEVSPGRAERFGAAAEEVATPSIGVLLEVVRKFQPQTGLLRREPQQVSLTMSTQGDWTRGTLAGLAATSQSYSLPRSQPQKLLRVA